MIINREESRKIDFVKVLLCIGIVFRHSLIDDSTITLPLTTLVNQVLELLTYAIVPCFFLISGFLYFLNFDRIQKFGSCYLKKTKSRVVSLIVPYLCANTVALLVLLAVSFVGVKTNSVPQPPSQFIDLIKGYWNTGSGSPYGYGLWFLRDLIVVSLLTPFVYLFAIKIKFPGILCLLTIWLLGLVDIQLPGIGVCSISFFTFGAYLALNNRSLFYCIDFSKKSRLIIVILMIISILLAIVLQSSITRNLSTVFILLLMFGIFSSHNIEVSKSLVTKTFFIYMYHGYILIALERIVLIKVVEICPSTLLFIEIISSVIVFFLLYFVYDLGLKFLPRTFKIIIGCR